MPRGEGVYVDEDDSGDKQDPQGKHRAVDPSEMDAKTPDVDKTSTEPPD